MGARTALLAVVAVVLGLAPGCANAGVRTVKDLEGVAPGKRVRIEGTVSLRGSTPFTTLVIEMEGGAVVAIESSSPELQREVKSLGGMRVALEGTVLPRMDAATPRLDAARYEVLPLPGGDRPMIGVVSMEADACIVTGPDGKRYWILGELAPALCDYAGARVWIVGHKASVAPSPKPRKCTPFTPTGYGVIDEVPAR